jgi:hypothetical protein
MQLSRYYRKGTTFLYVDTCLLLFKYSVTAALMTGCYCRHAPPLNVKCPSASLKIPHTYARTLTLKRVYSNLDDSVLLA